MRKPGNQQEKKIFGRLPGEGTVQYLVPGPGTATLRYGTVPGTRYAYAARTEVTVAIFGCRS